MPNMNGLELHRKLIHDKITLPVIYVTGHGNVQMAVEAMQMKAINFLEKPVHEQKLWESIRKALDLDGQNRSRRARRQRAEGATRPAHRRGAPGARLDPGRQAEQGDRRPAQTEHSQHRRPPCPNHEKDGRNIAGGARPAGHDALGRCVPEFPASPSIPFRSLSARLRVLWPVGPWLSTFRSPYGRLVLLIRRIAPNPVSSGGGRTARGCPQPGAPGRLRIRRWPKATCRLQQPGAQQQCDKRNMEERKITQEPGTRGDYGRRS